MRPLFWGIILITFGILMLLDNLGYADIGEVLGNFWPLILVAWGFSILRHRREASSASEVVGAQPIGGEPPVRETIVDTPPPQPAQGSGLSDELVHQSNVFGDITLRVLSHNFKGGSISTIFGDCYLDFSQGAIAAGDHELRLHCVFGDARVILPRDAAVAIHSSSILGDVAILGERKGGISTNLDATSTTYSSQPNRLKIITNTVFGEIRID